MLCPIRPIFLTLLMVLLATAASAQTAAEQRQIDRRWNREWRGFAAHFVEFEGRYYCFPSYDPERPSSHPMTVEEYIRHTAYEIRFRTSVREDNRFLVTKPIAGAQAATMLLLNTAAGSYGYIHSGRVVENEVHRGLCLTDVTLVDEEDFKNQHDQRVAWIEDTLIKLMPIGTGGPNGSYRDSLREFLYEANEFRKWDQLAAIELQNKEVFTDHTWRVLGVVSENAQLQGRYPDGDQGLHLAIISVKDKLVTAVPPDWIGKDISELDLLNALEQFGYTKQSFIQLVDQTRREHRDDYVRRVLDIVIDQSEDEAEPENDGDQDE